MIFVGWPLGVILGAWSVATLAVWWLARQRSRPREMQVAFAELWHRVLAAHHQRHPMHRHLPWLIVILQMLVVAAIVAAAGDPRPDDRSRLGIDTLIILDRSSSMDRGREQGISRLDLATQIVAAMAKTQEPNDRLIVIDACATPQVLLSLPSRKISYPDIDRSFFASDRCFRADFSRGFEFAQTLRDLQKQTEVIFLSDAAGTREAQATEKRCEGHANLRCTIQVVGTPAANLGCIDLVARRTSVGIPSLVVETRLYNASDAIEDVQLSLVLDGLEVAREPLQLRANEKRFFTFAPQITGATDIQVELRDRSGQAWRDIDSRDDRAALKLESAAPPRIALVGSQPNLFVQAALLALDDAVDLRFVDDDASWSALGNETPPNLAVFDASASAWPESFAPEHAIVFLGNEASAQKLGIATKGVVTNIRLESGDAASSLARDAFVETNVAVALRLVRKPGMTALATVAGDPVIATLMIRNTKTLVIAFDPKASDLPLRSVFPLLFANFLAQANQRLMPAYFSRSPAAFASWHKLIDEHLREEASELTSADMLEIRAVGSSPAPDERRAKIPDAPPLPGTYRIDFARGAPREFDLLAGDTIESDDRGAGESMNTATQPSSPAHGGQRKESPQWWKVALSCCLIGLALEMLLSARRLR
jgi:hypothetical protein